MKTLHLIGLLSACSVLLSSSEKHIVYNRAIIEFSKDSWNLERSVEEQMDALMESMPEGHRVELQLVAEHEIRNDYAQACRLSLQRAQTLVSYLGSRGIDVYNVAFHQYRQHLLTRTIEVAQAGSYDRGYIHSLSFYKHPQLPLMFTSSSVPHSTATCHLESLDNSKPLVIYHPDGPELHIPAHAFEYYSGYYPECVLININTCYYADGNDFVAADITTNSGKRMLESGGMIHIAASCLGSELRLRKGVEIEVMMPYSMETTSDGMDLFLGRDQHGIVNWNRARQGSVTNFSEEDFDWENEGFFEDEGFTSLDGYLVRAGQIGWINVDRFYDAVQPTELAVKLGDQKRDISVRMVFEDINSVLPGYYYNPDSLVMFDGIPRGEPVNVVAYGKIDGQYYWDQQRVTVGEARMVNLDVQPVSESSFQSSVAGL